MRFIIEQIRSATDQFDYREQDERLYWMNDEPLHGDGYTLDRNKATVFTEDTVFSEQDQIELIGLWAVIIPVGDLPRFNGGARCNTGINS